MSVSDSERESLGAPPPEAEKTGARVRSVAGWALRLAIGVAILYYLFTFIPFSEVVAGLARTRLGWVGLGLGVVAVERYLAAVRTTILSDHLEMSLSVTRNLEISLAATFYGMFLPGELAGGAVRWYKMSRPQGLRAQAAAVLTFDRLIVTIVMLVAGLGFWLLESPPLSNPALEVSFLLLLAGLIGAIALSLSGNAASLLFVPLTRLAHGLRLGFVSERVEKVLVAIQSFRYLEPRATATLLTVTVVRQLLAVGLLYCFAASLELEVGFITLGWINAFVNVAMMLPVSVSGLGVREGTLVFALAPYGVVGSMALAFSFLLLLSHILVAAAGGLVELKGLLTGAATTA